MRILAMILVLTALPLAARADDEQRARGLYEQAQVQYSIGKFDKAILLYQEAYELSKRPSLLFNIAQAHRLAGNHAKAKFFYESFLRATDAANREEVERRIKEMEEAIKKEEAEAAARKPVEARRVGKPAFTYAGIAGLGAGGVGVGLGIFFGMRARSYAEKAEGATSVWTPEHEAAEADGRAANRNMAIMLGVGGTLLASGAVLLWLGRPRPVSVAPVMTKDAVGLSVQGAF